VLLVAENISVRLSGETLVPFYYMHGFRDGDLHVWAICHEWVRESLRIDLDPALFARITFVADRALQRALFALGAYFPPRIADLVFNQLIHIVTQWTMRGSVQALIARHAIHARPARAPASWLEQFSTRWSADCYLEMLGMQRK
jgi:hypothetical protein